MKSPDANTLCPHCGTATSIERQGDLQLPGGIYLEEFEVLVRNEWRRLLGAEAYDRAHETRLIRVLAAIAMAPPRVDGRALLARELESVLADLAAEGRGRPAVRREVRSLFRAMRAVLERAEAPPATVEAVVARARAALERALDYPRRG